MNFVKSVMFVNNTRLIAILVYSKDIEHAPSIYFPDSRGERKVDTLINHNKLSLGSKQ